MSRSESEAMAPPDRLKAAIEVGGQCCKAVEALYGTRETRAMLQWWLRQYDRAAHGLEEEVV